MANIPPPRHVTSAIEAAWRIMGYVWADGNPPTSNNGLSGPSYLYLNLGVTLTEIKRCAGVLGWTQGNQWGLNGNGRFVCLRSSLHAACGLQPTIDFYHRCCLDDPSFHIPRLGLEAFLASVIECEGKTVGDPSALGIMDEARTPQATYCPRVPGVIALMNQHGLAAYQVGGNSLGCGSAATPKSTITKFPLPLLVYTPPNGGTGIDRYHASPLADWPDASGGGGGGTGVPHIMVIAMENRGYDASSGTSHYVVGGGEFTNVGALLATYGRLSNCWATYGPNGSGPSGVDGSHPMYAAVVGGSNFGIVDDTVAANPGTGLTNPILLDQLNTAGISWAVYAEDINTDLTAPKSEADGTTYIPRHAALIADFAHFNVSPHLSNVKDAGSTIGFGAGTPSWPTLINDLNGATPPAFVWFTPTAHNQGHGQGPTTGPWRGGQFTSPDLFLDKIIADVIGTSWYANGGNIIVWWDEGDARMTASVQSGGGQKMVFVVSAAAAARASRTVGTVCNDFGILRDIEDAYGLPHLNHAGDAAGAIGAGALTQLLTLPSGSAIPPAVPTGLSAVPGDTTVSIDWNDNPEPDLLGYNIYRGGTKINGSTPLVLSSYFDTGRTNGVTLSYRVSAVGPGGESAQATAVTATPTASPPPDLPPGPPTNLHGSAGLTNVSLTWVPPSDPDLNLFRIIRGGVVITTVAKTLSFYVDSGPLLPSTDYTYIVEAVDVGNHGTASAPLIVHTLDEEPPPPPPPDDGGGGLPAVVFDVSRLLGCDDTRVSIWDRGAVNPIRFTVPWTSCEWHRAIDQYGSAAIELQGIDCFAQYAWIQPRKHELVIERRSSGGDYERAWAGPIEAISSTPDYPGLRVSAHDVMWSTLNRKIHYNHTWGRGVDLSTIFRDAVLDGLSVDETLGVVLDIQASGVRMEDDEARKVLGGQGHTVDSVIDELSDTALDWTVIDRRVIVRGQELFPLATAMLSDHSFDTFTQFEIFGASAPSRVDVVGAGVGDADSSIVQSVRVASTVETEWGVYEYVSNQNDIRDAASALLAAKNILAGMNGVPRWTFTGGQLNQQRCPIRLSELIPGTRIPIDIGRDGRYPRINEVYRLTAVDAYVGPDQNHIDVAISPLGATVNEPATQL